MAAARRTPSGRKVSTRGVAVWHTCGPMLWCGASGRGIAGVAVGTGVEWSSSAPDTVIAGSALQHSVSEAGRGKISL